MIFYGIFCETLVKEVKGNFREIVFHVETLFSILRIFK